jgi:sporulation protein YlmC with PRC-barrel domain
MLDREQALASRGADVNDREGGRIGSVEEIYLDRETGEPEWVLVRTGWFGSQSIFVPLQGASLEDGVVVVPYDHVCGALRSGGRSALPCN